jgi:hypothetical protein
MNPADQPAVLDVDIVLGPEGRCQPPDVVRFGVAYSGSPLPEVGRIPCASRCYSMSSPMRPCGQLAGSVRRAARRPLPGASSVLGLDAQAGDIAR